MLNKIVLFCALILAAAPFQAHAGGYRTIDSFKCPEATQGVATDDSHFYAIGNQTIAKYTKAGELVTSWKETSMIKHFDGGIVIDGLLYCSHSNFPEVPMASSIEVFDTKDLRHVKSVSLGIENGSCTWVVRGSDCWYVGFAHYDRSGGTAGGEVLKDASWSQIVRYDNDWHRTGGWILPKELIDQLRPHSISGCLFIDGKFYCTGHDATKLFILEFPECGMWMKLTGEIPIPFKGQGISLDSDGFLWGIDRKSASVLKAAPENCTALEPTPSYKTWQKGPEWLKDAVIYQIYPSSYKDSDGNGIGDLPGVIQKLDYIASLGVKVIWFNPIFESGWIDGGYDIKDFYKVDPRFGTNTDLANLADECHRRGIRLFLDLVPGHTSMDHPWFRQSMEADANQRYSHYYIWTDELPSAKDSADLKRMLASPNPLQNTVGKWMSSDAPRGRFYMKNFFACQPSINYGYAHPDPSKPWQQGTDAPGPRAVQQEMKNIMAFWFDKGVDGFRVDMAKYLIKEDTDYSANQAFWRGMRKWMDDNYPDHVLMAEWGDPEKCLAGGFNIDMCLNQRKFPIRRMYFDEKHQADGGCYFSLDGGLPSTMDLYGNPWPEDKIDASVDASQMLKRYYDHYRQADAQTGNLGYYAMITGNHDHLRFNTGRRNSAAQLKVTMAWIMTQQMPILYYGDEIGIRSLADLPSREGSNYNGKERSGGRSPMQWDSSANAGFSTCAPDSIYLPVCPEWTPAHNYPDYLKWKEEGCKNPTSKGKITVESQDKDPESLLNWTRVLIELRKTTPAFQADSRWTPLYDEAHPYPMVYTRSDGKDTYLVALNPTGRGQSVTVPLDEKKATVVLSQGKTSYVPSKSGAKLTMGPVSVMIAKIQ